jgi:hypothetical protein
MLSPPSPSGKGADSRKKHKKRQVGVHKQNGVSLCQAAGKHCDGGLLHHPSHARVCQGSKSTSVAGEPPKWDTNLANAIDKELRNEFSRIQQTIAGIIF